MAHTLVFSTSESFRQLCRQTLETKGRKVDLKCGQDLTSNLNFPEGTYDEIVIHTAMKENSWFSLYEKIHDRWPKTRIIFATDAYDYMFDFRYWMADECIVISENQNTRYPGNGLCMQSVS